MAIRLAVVALAVPLSWVMVSSAHGETDRGAKFALGLRTGIATFHGDDGGFAIGLGGSMVRGVLRIDGGFDTLVNPVASGISGHVHAGVAAHNGPDLHMFAMVGIRHVSMKGKYDDIESSQQVTGRFGFDYGGPGGHVVLSGEFGRSFRHAEGDEAAGVETTDQRDYYKAGYVEVGVRF